MKKFIKNWWRGLKYDPNDPRYHAEGTIKIAVIGGGTGLSNMIRGLKLYSDHISAIVTVADSGASSGQIREEFDILPPGDIRQCISALAYDEDLVTDIFGYRFPKEKKLFGGHTLGNIWLAGLAYYYKSFEKALEVTSEIFRTAGKVLPATLADIQLNIEYCDGTKVVGENNLDNICKNPKKITLDKKTVKAYPKAVEAIKGADLVVIGPGSLYGSLIPNFLIPGIKNAVKDNNHAVKVYILNCSTERTQTEHYTIDDHIKALIEHTGERVFDYCLVNNRVLRKSSNESKLGEVNNITTTKEEIFDCQIILKDVISQKNPLYHDPEKLAKALIALYNEVKNEARA